MVDLWPHHVWENLPDFIDINILKKVFEVDANLLSRGVQVTATLFAHDEKHLQGQLETPNGVNVNWVHATQCTWVSAHLILMQSRDQANAVGGQDDSKMFPQN